MTEPSKTLTKTKKQVEAIKLLSSKAMHTLLFGGSRSGKSLIITYAIMIRAIKAPGTRHLILRKHFRTVKTSIWLGTMPDVKKMCWPDMPIKENNQDFYWTLPNGSEIWIGGLDDKERVEKILGTEYSTIFFNESSELSYDSVQVALTRLAQKSPLKNRAYYDCNPPNKKHWSHKLFVENKDPLTDEPRDGSRYACMLLNPVDNAENLADGYIDDVLSGLSLRQRQRFELGEWLDDIDGALWTSDLINQFRVKEPPKLLKIVVAIDPATTANQSSDNTGIVVAGIDASNHVYILDDVSGKYTPAAWAKKAIAAYNNWNAHLMVAETNQGGDLVKHTINTEQDGIKVKTVHAKTGKFSRAEPVQALYEQMKIHHCGVLVNLEDEMTSWVPDKSKGSPDRVDALVYAVHFLALQNKVKACVEFW